MAFVMDCSLALSWYFRDEITEQSNTLRERLVDETLTLRKMYRLTAPDYFGSSIPYTKNQQRHGCSRKYLLFTGLTFTAHLMGPVPLA
jgi:hypothetical protein